MPDSSQAFWPVGALPAKQHRSSAKRNARAGHCQGQRAIISCHVALRVRRLGLIVLYAIANTSLARGLMASTVQLPHVFSTPCAHRPYWQQRPSLSCQRQKRSERRPGHLTQARGARVGYQSEGKAVQPAFMTGRHRAPGEIRWPGQAGRGAPGQTPQRFESVPPGKKRQTHRPARRISAPPPLFDTTSDTGSAAHFLREKAAN